MNLPFDLTFEEAAKLFHTRVPLTREQFDLLVDWVKTRAFTVATVTSGDVLQGIMDGVQQAIDDGLTLADFRSVLDDLMDANGWSGLTPWHAETVFRTNTQAAYGAGRWDQQQAQREDFPALEYHAILDDRTRATHRELDGTVHAIGDPFWQTRYPPWDYNCRCHAEALSIDEASAIGIEPVNILDDTQSDFTSPAAAASDAYAPDLSRFSPALRAEIEQSIASFNPSTVAG